MYYTRFRTVHKVFCKLLQTVTMYTFVFKLDGKQKYYRPGRLVDLLIHFWLWTHPHAAYMGFFHNTYGAIPHQAAPDPKLSQADPKLS